MIVSNAKKVGNGWDFNLKVENTEMDFLINFAIVSLLSEGLIHIEEKEEEQMVDLLGHLQEDEMYQA